MRVIICLESSVEGIYFYRKSIVYLQELLLHKSEIISYAWLETIKAMNETKYQGEITFEQGDYISNYKNWMLFVDQVEKDLN